MEVTISTALSQEKFKLSDILIVDALFFYLFYLVHHEVQFHCVYRQVTDCLKQILGFLVSLLLLVVVHRQNFGDYSRF